MKIISKSVRETFSLGRKLARLLKPGDIVCLLGDLGSGKTLLTKGIAQGFGIEEDAVLSPSFVLLREYLAKGLCLYHFDLYRLSAEADILGLGYEEYLYGKGICVIEWAGRLGILLPKEFLKIEMSVKGKSRRNIILTACGKRYDEAIERLKKGK